MNNTHSSSDDHIVALQFKTIRNISSKRDSFKGRKILVGLVDTTELLKLGKDSGDGKLTTNVADKKANVRDAVVAKKGKMISVKTGVTKEIYSTLENEPDIFHFLNNGITILCDRSEENKEKPGYLSLKNPSIANGGHTHDVIRAFHHNHPASNDALCKVEVIYVDIKHKENQDLDDEISIARNTQKKVADVSIAGKRGILDDLHWLNNQDIGRSETDKHKFDPLKLLQVTFLLCPDSMWNKWEDRNLNRASVYSAKSSCLKTYRKFHNDNLEAKKFIDKVSSEALKLYFEFQRTDIIKGMFKQIKSDSYTDLGDGKYRLKDGWILPIISALSHFLDTKTFKVNMPSEKLLRGIIASIYESGYENEKNVQLLGKNSQSYTQVLRLLQSEFDLESLGKQTFK